MKRFLALGGLSAFLWVAFLLPVVAETEPQEDGEAFEVKKEMPRLLRSEIVLLLGCLGRAPMTIASGWESVCPLKQSGKRLPEALMADDTHGGICSPLWILPIITVGFG